MINLKKYYWLFLIVLIVWVMLMVELKMIQLYIVPLGQEAENLNEIIFWASTKTVLSGSLFLLWLWVWFKITKIYYEKSIKKPGVKH